MEKFLSEALDTIPSIRTWEHIAALGGVDFYQKLTSPNQLGPCGVGFLNQHD